MTGPACGLLASHGLPTVVSQALDDRALTPTARLAMWYLVKRLDVVEYREVYVESLAHEMGIQDTTCGQALRLLIARGYLDEHTKRKPRALRFPWSRRTTHARAA